MDSLIFDYDGVLANSEPLHWRSWAELLASYGLSLSWEQYLDIGRGIHDQAFLEAFGSSLAPRKIPESIWARSSERTKRVLEWSLMDPPIARETIEMVRSLRQFRVGLVTSSGRAEVEPVLRAVGIYECFNGFVFGDDVTRHKPDPQPYKLIGRLLDARSGVVFEDSDTGIESARGAGFRTVKVEHPSILTSLVSRNQHCCMGFDMARSPQPRSTEVGRTSTAAAMNFGCSPR